MDEFKRRPGRPVKEGVPEISREELNLEIKKYLESGGQISKIEPRGESEAHDVYNSSNSLINQI